MYGGREVLGLSPCKINIFVAPSTTAFAVADRLSHVVITDRWKPWAPHGLHKKEGQGLPARLASG
eukprot:CAMPEP_0206444778 /NCGR_PEP_ID=MMETSP0324_2-20121206/15105_1 /ASSEMBLY_ACC=CAM_ASM_000836 /TAXON_ID=2866 /ORGANISM="Crypthecodinium cohnii, Strain Seligo" /LENGTH=64 /DNA_ID=CAMNT_0053912847 /DNA_START=302 /DNA_END=492 /DNA_ORIENTATION=-